MKRTIDCPFFIKYGKVGYTAGPRKAKLPPILFMVKVTKANYCHTCTPSVESHRLSMYRSGKLAPRYDSVK